MTAPGLYRHYKGDLYLVIGEADDSTNGKPREPVQVVYWSLGKHTFHRRDVEQFSEVVPWPDGSQRPRFERVAS